MSDVAIWVAVMTAVGVALGLFDEARGPASAKAAARRKAASEQPLPHPLGLFTSR